ncbi:uncharacterized protein [Littorina saxatilis]|uniref:uncharacterized protein n=1 Tax=Littorina saxatilis TaxID=31220 RepID=UPI0038B56872
MVSGVQPLRSCFDTDDSDTEEEVEASAGIENTKDHDWQEPTPKEKQSCGLTEDLNNVDPFQETKYLVFESKLEELLSVCRKCSSICQVMRKGVEGTAVEYCCSCEHCNHKFTWTSQPYSKRLPLGNLVLAAAVFFTACSPSRLITLFKSASIAIFGQTTYYSLQGAYLVPAVRNVWARCQEKLFAARPRARPVKLAGDGRCDSPGHCAKYGAYSLLDATTMEVLHIECVGKKLEAASHKAGYGALSLWSKSIKNHLYYCSQSTEESATRVEEIKAKWVSIANHISNQHHGHGDLFPHCLHGDLSDIPRAWITKEKPYLLRDIGQLSPDVQTAHLEAYHSVINHFAPKMLHFTFPVMQAKLYLAAMHTNTNAGREQATTEEGELRWKIARPRANKGQPTAKPVKETITRCKNIHNSRLLLLQF